MDINELKREYPFLKTVLAAYEEYDKGLDNEPQLDTFYTNDVTYATDKEKYRPICIKLLRNLKLLKSKELKPPNNLVYCTYLYHWLYKETNESGISDLLISTIFKVFHEKMAGQAEQYICPYSSYKKELYKTKNLAKLSYLIHNIDDIKRILKNTADEHYCFSQKYLKDCVDIYRDANEHFCTKIEQNKNYNQNICSELSQFASNYSYITQDPEIGKTVPNIQSGIWTEKLPKCQTNNETPASDTESPDNTVAAKPNTSSTVIGSMVGIPPFLVLIYKFTPVGKFFRFGNKNNTKITSNLDKEIENELLHVMQKDSNIKDIHSKYNVGYEPI